MLENLENVLIRKLGFDPEGAAEKIEAIVGYAENGPLPVPPAVVVGAGHIPFETERQHVQSLSNFMNKNDGALFHSTQDDRYVLETAFSLKAHILVTNDIHDFRRGSYVDLDSDEVHLCSTADHTLIVATPRWARDRLLTNRMPTPIELAAENSKPTPIDPT